MRKAVTVFILAFAVSAAHAQFFSVAPVAEAVYYGRQAPAILYGGMIAVGDGVTIGLRVLYGQSLESEKPTTSFEATMFGRVYFLNFAEAKGLFGQFNFGFVLFSPDGTVTAWDGGS